MPAGSTRTPESLSLQSRASETSLEPLLCPASAGDTPASVLKLPALRPLYTDVAGVGPWRRRRPLYSP